MAIVPPHLYEALARQAEQEFGVPPIAPGAEEGYDPTAPDDALARVAWTGLGDESTSEIRAGHRAISARGDDLHGSAFHALRGTAPNPAEGRSGEEIQRAGRGLDFAQPYPEVTVRRAPSAELREGTGTCSGADSPAWVLNPHGSFPMHAAIERTRARRKMTEAPARTYETAGGAVSIENGRKTYTTQCAECCREFMVQRPASQKRKWPTVCAGCKTERKRRLAAERAKRYRQRQSAGETKAA
ncbi:hypothetical protein ACIGW8_28485 [Streptomyces sioyaensis]|uniref:hypothetical protein n=1 Tax=Streptomyces sioyaensis TaxID=67364 RepID=UPI0037CDFA18